MLKDLHNHWYVMFRCEECDALHCNGGYNKEDVEHLAEGYKLRGLFVTIGFGNVDVGY